MPMFTDGEVWRGRGLVWRGKGVVWRGKVLSGSVSLEPNDRGHTYILSSYLEPWTLINCADSNVMATNGGSKKNN